MNKPFPFSVTRSLRSSLSVKLQGEGINDLGFMDFINKNLRFISSTTLNIKYKKSGISPQRGVKYSTDSNSKDFSKTSNSIKIPML